MRVHQTGDVTVVPAASRTARGRPTTFSQIIAQELGVGWIASRSGTPTRDGVPFGQGSYGSRTFSVEGAVIYQAAQVIKAKALKVGAYMLKASEDDVVFEDGKVSLKKDPAQSKIAAGHRLLALVRVGSAARCRAGSRGDGVLQPVRFQLSLRLARGDSSKSTNETGEVDVVEYVVRGRRRQSSATRASSKDRCTAASRSASGQR